MTWTWPAVGSADSGVSAGGCCPSSTGTGSSSGRSTQLERACTQKGPTTSGQNNNPTWVEPSAHKPKGSLTEGTSTAVGSVTWLDPGKWDGLVSPTCRNVTEMIPKVACMTSRHHDKQRYRKRTTWEEGQLFGVLHCSYTTKKANLKLISQHIQQGGVFSYPELKKIFQKCVRWFRGHCLAHSYSDVVAKLRFGTIV